MLAEGVNPSGQNVGFKADADGKLLISGVTISGDVTVDSVTIDNTESNPVPVTGALTDTQLRATAVPVSGPLTDTQLRATAVPVSGPLTDAQLRASAVPVSAEALPLPTGAATSAQIGEVQASPTANTVLDRLKALATLLSGGLPAALTGSGNLKVAIVESSGGGLLTDAELRAADVKVTLDSEAVVLGAGSATIGKLGANSGVDIGDVDVTSLPAHLGTVASNTSVVGVEFTRPSDTTGYIARDVVCNSTSSPSVITFADFARVNQGSGVIVRARLFTDKKDVTATFRLHLFHTAPTAIADNSPYTLLYVNAPNRIGQIDFPAMASEDPTNSTASAAMRPAADGSSGPPNLWYQAASGTRAIYGVLETLSAFTPASGQKFFIQLAAIND